jgi:ComF family protein
MTWQAIGAAAAAIGREGFCRTIDLLLPPCCPACGGATLAADGLCLDCWPCIRFIGAPLCDACGIPLPVDLGPGALCGSCVQPRRLRIGRARAAVIYDDASRGMILGFKNTDRTHAVPLFARWMARAGADVLPQAELLIPVPLHWTRLFARSYNQAAMLAHGLHKLTGIRVLPDALVRRRRTPKLGTLSAAERARTVSGIFAVRESASPRLAGRRVMLIDDVLTSGATTRGCAAVLLAAGAAGVDVLAIARTLREPGPS